MQTPVRKLPDGLVSMGVFHLQKIRKVSMGNFPLGRARTICHKSHSFTGPSLSLSQTIQMAIVSCSVFTLTRLSSSIPVKQMLIIGIYCHEKSDICILPSSRFTVVETSPVNEVRVRFYEVTCTGKTASNEQRFLPTTFICDTFVLQ